MGINQSGMRALIDAFESGAPDEVIEELVEPAFGRPLKKPLGIEFYKIVDAMVDFHILRSKDIGKETLKPAAIAIIKQIHGDETHAQQFAERIGDGGGDSRATDLRNTRLHKMSFEAKLARKIHLKQLFDNAAK